MKDAPVGGSFSFLSFFFFFLSFFLSIFCEKFVRASFRGSRKQAEESLTGSLNYVEISTREKLQGLQKLPAVNPCQNVAVQGIAERDRKQVQGGRGLNGTLRNHRRRSKSCI